MSAKKVTLESVLQTFAETVNDRFIDLQKDHESMAKAQASELAELKLLVQKNNEFLASVNALLKLAQTDIDLLHKLMLTRKSFQENLENSIKE